MKRGDTYPSKEICLIRIGEQSNLFNGDIMIIKSDNERIIAKSRHNSLFTIRVVKSDNYGWKVTVYNVTYAHAEIAKIDDEVIVVEEGSHYDDDLIFVEKGNPDDDDYEGGNHDDLKTRSTRTPIKARWIVPLIREEIRQTPNMSNMSMKTILSIYVKDKFLTASLLQNARTTAILHVFGTPSANVPYFNGFVAELTKRDHQVVVQTKTSKEVLEMIKTNALKEEIDSKKKRVTL